MKLNTSKGANVNYLAEIVHVDKFSTHPNTSTRDVVNVNLNLVDLSKIWHDASEIPEHYCKQIFYQDKTGACRFTVMHNIVVMLQLKWDDFAAENISRWAYINDLLPKGGKI